ncbi:hypothetical protein B0H14DRAFT_2655081 [Mycena olivaceomarginata]|nr:hypothetical protein B0H14DRAFT_2655081 [Mycena olivaceomarginata]
MVLSSGGQAKSYWSEFISGLSNILRNLNIWSNLCDCELRHKTVTGSNCVCARQPKAKIRYVSRQEEAQCRVHAIQNKRDQWKAALAWYYERHPEVKEKKHLQAAEKRCRDGRPLISLLPEMPVVFSAAKKLARRRWDPPKQIKCMSVVLTGGMADIIFIMGYLSRTIWILASLSGRGHHFHLVTDELNVKFNADVFCDSKEQQLGNFSDMPDIGLIPDALHVRAGTYTHDDILELWKEAESGGHAIDIPSPQYITAEWQVAGVSTRPPAYTNENLAAESLLDLQGEGSAMRGETREPPPIWASLVPEYESSDDEAAFAGTLK